MSPIESRVHRFHPDALDPVTVYVEQHRPNASRITVQCYNQAWTAYWGAHGERPVEDFICSCDDEYITDYLTYGTANLQRKDREKHQRVYVARIVYAMKAHFLALRSAGGAA